MKILCLHTVTWFHAFLSNEGDFQTDPFPPTDGTLVVTVYNRSMYLPNPSATDKDRTQGQSFSVVKLVGFQSFLSPRLVHLSSSSHHIVVPSA